MILSDEPGEKHQQRALAPGSRKEDIDISLEGEMLTIKAVKKGEEILEGSTAYLDKRCFGEYAGTLALRSRLKKGRYQLPSRTAYFEARLPKAEEIKPRHIEVKVK